MVLFRADGGGKTGIGHIMRCMSIARQVQKFNTEVLFVTADEAVTSLIREGGFSCRVLHSAYDAMEEELPGLFALLEETKADTLVVDSYYVTPAYLGALRKKIRLAYVDDVYAFDYDVDILINYNLYGAEMGYESATQFRNTKLLLGTSYVPLREEFQNKACPFREKVGDILLSAGGGNYPEIARNIVETLRGDALLSDVVFHILCGGAYEGTKMLSKWADTQKNIVLHVDERDMAGLMQNVDIAISAGGSTLYELACMGIPFVCFSFAENQKRPVESFTKKEISLGGYDYAVDAAASLQGILADVKALASDANLRKILRQRAQGITDGCGASRIAALLCEK